MITLSDYNGQEIRLTGERLNHILKHPEMEGQDHLIAETLLTPHIVVLSRRDPRIHLYHKLYDATPVTRKYLLVAVKYLEKDAFVMTAFFTDKEKRGEVV